MPLNQNTPLGSTIEKKHKQKMKQTRDFLHPLI